MNLAQARPRSALLAGILLFAIPHARGQVAPTEFSHLTVADGLSHSQVNAITQDQQGFLWFGTRAGLNRFDGYGCKVFLHDAEDSTSVPGDFVLSLCAARDGSIWIGTQGRGLGRFDPVSGTFMQVRSRGAAEPTNVIALLEDSDGELWAGTSQGLYEVVRDVHPAHLQLHADHSVAGPADEWNTVRTICEGAHHELWLGTERGVKVFKHDDHGADRFHRLPPWDGGIVNAIVRDFSGAVWIGSRRGNVRRLNPSTGVSEEILRKVQVRALMTDSEGNIWVGSIDRGLFRISPGQSGEVGIVNYTHQPDDPASLGADEAGCVFQDRTGKFWIGTNGGGVSLNDPARRKFLHHHHVLNDPKSLSDNLVRCITEDRHGSLWVGTYGGGLNVRARGSGEFRRCRIKGDGTADHQVASLVARRNGEIWASFAFSGLVRIFPDGRRQQRYLHAPGDTSGLVGINVIRTMCEDHAGDVWLGTHGFGLLRFVQSSGRFLRYPGGRADSTSSSTSHVWALYEDSRGYLWMGGWNRGLSCLDPERKTFRHFLHRRADSTSISDHPILCISEDRRGRIWIGSAGGGLQMLAPPYKSFVHYAARQGFADNMVYGIEVDDDDCLWVSTSKGLARFNPETGETRVFDEHDGVQSREFVQGAYCRGRDGTLYFGGINGFNAFLPGKIVLNPVPPPVVITRFAVFEREAPLPRSITATKAITLERDQNFFSFEFAALDFTAPSRNKFAYRLEGFDHDWTTLEGARSAHYTNVGPGRYLFRVRGSNNDGVWNLDGVSVTVVVLPSIWETWWFRLLLGVAVAGILYALYAYRVKKLLEVERTRERIARDLHDEISATLSGIAFFSRAVHADSENLLSRQSARFVSLIQQSSVEVMELLHDIVWSISPQGDRFDAVVAKCRRYASDLCDAKAIRSTFDFPETLRNRSVDPERRKNFWLMYKEMVTNAVRHAECSALTIRLHDDGHGMLHLHVEDNGKGFDPSRPTTRHGLRNIRSRAESLGAQLTLTTAPGEGAVWDFACKL